MEELCRRWRSRACQVLAWLQMATGFEAPRLRPNPSASEASLLQCCARENSLDGVATGRDLDEKLDLDLQWQANSGKFMQFIWWIFSKISKLIVCRGEGLYI
jgi:hypothetical protein